MHLYVYGNGYVQYMDVCVYMLKDDFTMSGVFQDLLRVLFEEPHLAGLWTSSSGRWAFSKASRGGLATQSHSSLYMAMGQNPCTPGEHQNSW
jgi:hypothetical protein